MIEESRARVRHAAQVEPWPVVTGWGLAWTAAFAYTAAVTEGSPPPLDVPVWTVGVAWLIAIVLLLDLEGPESSVVFVFTVSALYMAEAAYERDLLWFGLGVWLGAVNVAAYGLAPERYSTAMAVVGGGALLVGGWLTRRRSRFVEEDARGVRP